jgi:hypothetical protein
MNIQTTKKVLAGRIIMGLLLAMLAVDALMKIFKATMSLEETMNFGYTESAVVFMGLALLLGVALSTWKKTSMLGMVIITGYLGGAVATHSISGIGSIFAPLIFGAVLWFSFYLKEERLEAFAFWK